MRCAPTGDHGDAVRPLPILAGYVADYRVEWPQLTSCISSPNLISSNSVASSFSVSTFVMLACCIVKVSTNNDIVIYFFVLINKHLKIDMMLLAAKLLEIHDFFHYYSEVAEPQKTLSSN